MVGVVVALVSIVISVYAGLHLAVTTISLLISLSTVIVLAARYRNSYQIKRLVLLHLICLLLMFRAHHSLPPSNFEPSHFAGQREVQLVVDSQPKINENSLSITSHNVKMHTASEKEWYGGVVITFPRYQQVEYGDQLLISGELRPIDEIEDEGYREYLHNHKVFGTMYWPKVLKKVDNQGNIFVSAGINVQKAANQKLRELLPRDAASFVAGVVLGSEQELSEEFGTSLKATGTSHIIVASGYNISIIISIVLNIFKKQGKIALLLIAITFVLCYTFVSGFQPSIIRAGIMAILVLLVAILGRQKQAAYLLLCTAIIMLTFHPYWLLDTSFQLSFMATLGIIALQPELGNKLRRLPVWLSESISTTLSAQIFVLPIIAVTFGSISVISLVTNVLILWVIPVIMILGGLLIITAFVSQFLSVAIAACLYPLFWYVKQVILSTAHVPLASISVNFSWILGIAYYVAIVIVWLRKVIWDVQTT